MALKVVYLVPLMHLGTTDSLGVKKKIFGQVTALQEYGFDVMLIDALMKWEYYPQWVILDYPLVIKLIRLPFKRAYQIWHSARFKKRSFSQVLRRIKVQGDCIVYLRHAILSPQLLLFKLRMARLPNVHFVYMEIPTWPYDGEHHARFYERFLRIFLKGVANRIVTFAPLDNVLGIPAIHITNGICSGQLIPDTLLRSFS